MDTLFKVGIAALCVLYPKQVLLQSSNRGNIND
jgi:hypothetical protein